MVLFGEKELRCAPAGYLILVITGALAFSMAESPDPSGFEAKRTVQSGALAPAEITPDWLAEGAAIIGKDEGCPPASSRAGTVRMSAPPGIQNAGMFLAQSELKTVKKTRYPGIKNTILIKLRI
jgi:hypothetical protein